MIIIRNWGGVGVHRVVAGGRCVEVGLAVVVVVGGVKCLCEVSSKGIG